MGESPGGSLVLSIDAELGWGFHDRPSPPMERLDAARDGWRTLARLTDEYDVPATWAVVGHLLLEDCDGRHDDHPTPPDWFARERSDWQDRPDLRFANDLVADLLAADVDHDVGCHTFSHVIFDDDRMGREVIEAELTASIEQGREYGLEYDSFVFPRNAVGYRDLLAEYGFRVYRPRRGQSQQLRRRLGKLQAVANPGRNDLVEPSVDEYGLVALPPSMYLFGFQGKLRRMLDSIWIDPVVRQVTAGIDRAVAENGIFHGWLHPSDFLTDRDVARMRAIFDHVDRRRADGLTVETMADVARRCAPDAGIDRADRSGSPDPR